MFELKRNNKRIIFSLKPILFLLCVFFCFSVNAAAQDDDFPSMSHLRQDVKDSVIVARVVIKSYEEIDRIGGERGGYVLYRIQGEVLEVFKGAAKKGQVLEFYYSVEDGYKRSIVGDDCVIFLQRNYYDKEKKRVLGEIENSRLKTGDALLEKLRKIKNETRKKKR